MLELTVRLIASLAVVVGLLLLITKLGSKRFAGRKDDPVRVVHTQALSRSGSVSVVEVYGRVLVLGTTDQHVNLLTELDPDTLTVEAQPEADPAAAAAVPASSAPAPTPSVATAAEALTLAAAAWPRTGLAAADTAETDAVFQQAVFAPAYAEPARTEHPVGAATHVLDRQPVPAGHSVVDQLLAEESLDLSPAPAPVAAGEPSLVDRLLGDFESGADTAGWASTGGARPAGAHLRIDAGKGPSRAPKGPRTDSRTGPLSGSVLSPATWRQAMDAAWGRK